MGSIHISLVTVSLIRYLYLAIDPFVTGLGATLISLNICCKVTVYACYLCTFCTFKERRLSPAEMAHFSTILPRSDDTDSFTYSWIGKHLHFGLTSSLVLSLSEFKTKIRFVFLVKNHTRHVFFNFSYNRKMSSQWQILCC